LLAFAALDALRERCEVYPVVDAIAGTSMQAHRAALESVTQAGGKPTSWVSLACELQCDWARQENAPESVQDARSPRPGHRGRTSS
jgi:isochorismate hydrolase